MHMSQIASMSYNHLQVWHLLHGCLCCPRGKFTLPLSELLLHAQVITDFIEAHPDRKITKKWVHAKVKDIAQREKGCWVINPQALPHAGVVAL